MGFESQEAAPKKIKKWYVIGAIFIIWHLILAWGAYFMPSQKPEDAPEVKPCLAKYSAAQLSYIAPNGMGEDIDKILQFARYEGLLDSNGKLNYVFASNILMGRFNWSKEDVDAYMDYAHNSQSSFFETCSANYRSLAFQYSRKVFLRETGNGWSDGPRWIWLWSTIFSHG
jgi:hypothetical protein